MNHSEQNDAVAAGNNVLRCTQVGLIGGTLLSLLVIVQYVFLGPRIFARFGPSVTLPVVIGVYIIGCTFAGLIVGVLFPLTRSTLGSWVVGTIAAIPIGLAIDRTLRDGKPWASDDLVVLGIFCMALGGSLGVKFHRRYGKTGQTRR